MAENKLLGKLQLDSSGVMKTIQDVNNALKDLGKGVDLNLTNILNAKVNTQLQQLKQQIEEVGKAARNAGGGGSSGQASKVKEITQLLKDQYEAQIKFNKANTEGALQLQADRYDKATEALKKYDQELVQQTSKLPAIQKMQKQLEESQIAAADKAQKAREKSSQEQLKIAQQREKQQEAMVAEAVKRGMAYYDAQTKAAKKAAQEQLRISQQREKEQEAMIAEAVKKGEAYYNSQVQGAVKLLKEQADIEKKLASGTAGPNETNVLNQRLAANKKALEQYGDAIVETAKADASVVEAQQGVALAQAQAQDRALKEHQKAQEEAARSAEENARKMEEYQKKWATYAVSALGAASLSILKKQWTEAVNYAKSYYDALNEIRVVTGMTESQAMEMGQQMRDLAKEMKVTSTELSQAAITFYRQGLEPEEVQDRLKWVTEYAKIANMPFQDAAELMTAAINTMGDAMKESGIENVVEHVADVWLYLGDSAATSGEEIGKAMQKASASATEFGLSFEWLGTYIAVVAEQTRQAPEAIGNAFNSMMARMHQIKANGFNDEDTTKLNDVAKALATINVELLDSQGDWRDMNLIYEDIAAQWENMDAKQRGYIATTMAGTRQQNVFYALMNDMSKGLEGGSRAWELYTGAMNAAGTATEKYAVWQESIAASEANMQNSLEQLYSNLQPSLIKGFYDVIVTLVGGLNNLGGVLPMVAAGIVGLGVAIKTATTFANPLVAVMSAAAAVMGTLIVAGGIGSLFGGGEDSVARYEKAAESYKKAGENIKELQGLQTTLNDTWEKQASGAQLSSSELVQYNTALEKVTSLSPEAAAAVAQLTQGLGDQAQAIEKVKTALEQELEAEKAKQQFAAEQRLNNWTADKSVFSSENWEIVKASGQSVLEELKKFGYNGDTLSLVTAARQAYIDGLSEDRELQGAFVQYFNQAWDDATDELQRTADWWDDSDAAVLEEKLYRDLFGDVLDGKEYQDLLASQMNDLISEALLTVGQDLDFAQKSLLQEKLKRAIIGEDGVLSADDLMGGPFGAVARVKQVIAMYKQQVRDGMEEAFDDEDYKGVFLEMFQKFFDRKDAKQFVDSWADSMGEDFEGYVERFVTAINSLLEAGVSEIDIRKLLESMMVDQWDEVSLDSLLGKMFHLDGNFSDYHFFEGAVFEELDEEVMNTIYSMVQLGTSIEQVEAAYANSSSLDEFKAKLAEIKEEAGSTDEAITSLKDFLALGSQTEGLQNVQALEEALDAINRANFGTAEWNEAWDVLYKNFGSEFVLKNAESIEDRNKRISASIAKMREEAGQITPSLDDLFSFYEQWENAQEAIDNIENGKDVAKARKTLNEIFGDELQSLEGGDSYLDVAKQKTEELGQAVESVASISGDLGKALFAPEQTDEALQSLEEYIESLANLKKYEEALADYNGPDQAKQAAAQKVLYEGFKDSGLSLDSKTFGADATAKVAAYRAEVDATATSLGLMTTAQAEAAEEAVKAAEEEKQAAEEAAKAEEARLQAYRDYLTEVKNSNTNKAAEKNNYADQLSALREVSAGGNNQAAIKWWENLGNVNKELQTALQNTYPKVATAIAKMATGQGSAAANARELAEALDEARGRADKLNKLDSAKYFKETNNEIKELVSGTGNIADALATFDKEQETAILAQEEFNKIMEEGGVTAETTVEDVSNLSKALGWDAQSILKNWGQIGPLLEELGMDMEAVRQQLQQEVFVNITGSSSADFSNILNGLMTVENEASAAVRALLATGQFEIEERELDEDMVYQMIDEAGNIVNMPLHSTGKAKFIVPKGGSIPTKGGGGGGSKGGGGGGGGGNKTKETSAAMKALDRMSRIQKLQEHRRSLYSAQAGLYEQSGELQGVIAYNEKEIEVIEEQNETLEDNIKELEEWIAKKKEEMTSLDQSSEEYTTAKDELEKLEDTHQEYTLALINNKKEVLSLRDAIKQLNNEIRDMQIEVYEEVVAALEARDEAEQERLEGTIAVQKSILEVMQEQEERQNSMLQGRIALENAILEKIMAQKEAMDETQEARRNFEETILGIIEEEKALQDSMNQARINAEEDILSTIQEMKDLHDRMLNGRIDMENTILSILKEQVATQQKLLSATITVENKISSVLQAQLNRQKSMLQGRIGAENAVFALVKERYETEKSAALEAANAAKEGNQAQIEALQKQKQLLDEQLQLRKKQAEEQDKAVELAELEAKYARISADPTRMKEALEIRKQIDDLRDEMAWETAQKEIDAQKKAIDDQISALQGSDGGVAQINAYYEELFKHPTKLLTEVDEILKGTDDEIIEWLKANSEDYTWASEANKKKMVEDWKNTLREMRGETIDFRDEVTEIMQLSDEEIVAWLKKNDEEYLLASDNKRKQLLEGWEQMMRDMHGQEISYAEEVARILGGSQEEVLNWLRTNDSNYANASPAEREKMVEDWKASLDDMYGVTKTYWREIDLILSGSEEDFISYMTQHSLQYADASKTSQEEMVKSWRQTYKDMKGEATTYWDEIDRLANGGYDAYIEELKRRSTSYATGSDGEKAQMLKEWTDIWDQMHGITKTYWEKVNEVIDGGLDNFIEFMKENNAEYAKASDSDKASTVMGWTDMWHEMEGSSKDYRDEVAAVMAQGHDAYIGYMTSMSKEYADATEEEKKTMLKSYEDMWDQMTGKQKSYEDEANTIIAQGQEAIISTLTEYTTKYQDVGKLQSEAYIDEWKDKLEKLKKALQDVAINTDVFDYTQPDAVSESTSANSSANTSSSTEENKLYWRAEANWQRTFESRREALDYKNTKISELEAKLAASPKDENILSKLETWRNTPILYYARGGIADFTGPAWLDGSKRNPERILSPRQTELFDILVSSLEDMSVHVPSFPSFDWAREGSTDGGFSFGDIVINVAHLDSDTDYDDMAERVLDSVMQKINRGSVVGGIRFSK